MRLAEGHSVTAMALDVGYQNPSAFIEMFKRALGVTPEQYFAANRSAEASGDEHQTRLPPPSRKGE